MQILIFMSDLQTSNPNTESFAALFEESLTKQDMRAGEVISAEVVRVDHNFVVVNAGLKSEAYIPLEEFLNDAGEVEVQAGDFVSVAIDALENGYGDTILSRDKAKGLASWLSLEKALDNNELVTGTITGKVKGGMTVMVNGIRAFLPGSLVDTRPVKDTTPYEGKTLEFRVIKLDRKRNNVVLSRRAVIEATQGEERAKLLETLKEGAIVEGVVKNITDYGARRYPSGTRLFGKVTNITDYGAFVEVESGIEGLVHVSEMDWTNKNVAPSKVVQLGDEVEVMVLEIDEDRRRISLGMKQCKPNPWDDFSRNFKKGDKLQGAIKSITDFGVFIGLPGGIDGLVHLSDLSWSETGEEAVRKYKKGDEVEAIVLGIDVEKERISLGIKQLEGDPFSNFVAMNDKGSIVDGVVKTVDAKGAVVQLSAEVEGYLRASEIAQDRVEDARNVLKEGDKVNAMIINIDRKSRGINLSVKAKDSAEQQEAIRGLASSDSSSAATGTTNLGALLKAKLDGQNQ
ncbi:30S ribosomal protein S1 [Paraburkholderia fungorum]|uniref:30S ribosomal protein S1 n=1 Tax=Paraburkholderia fungorum TaxID=134537 RepID=UPI000DB5DD19|nr:30S ribosomal protein S1 [Paraburkholderia fungorum]PZR45710.1 MAG: 30S ribosomal protein S1 [Paraburkholderia fungorum]